MRLNHSKKELANLEPQSNALLQWTKTKQNLLRAKPIQHNFSSFLVNLWIALCSWHATRNVQPTRIEKTIPKAPSEAPPWNILVPLSGPYPWMPRGFTASLCQKWVSNSVYAVSMLGIALASCEMAWKFFYSNCFVFCSRKVNYRINSAGGLGVPVILEHTQQLIS